MSTIAATRLIEDVLNECLQVALKMSCGKITDVELIASIESGAVLQESPLARELVDVSDSLKTNGFVDLDKVSKALQQSFKQDRVCSISCDYWCGRCTRRLFASKRSLLKHIDAVKHEPSTRSQKPPTNKTIKQNNK